MRSFQNLDFFQPFPGGLADVLQVYILLHYPSVLGIWVPKWKAFLGFLGISRFLDFDNDGKTSRSWSSREAPGHLTTTSMSNCLSYCWNMNTDLEASKVSSALDFALGSFVTSLMNHLVIGINFWLCTQLFHVPGELSCLEITESVQYVSHNFNKLFLIGKFWLQLLCPKFKTELYLVRFFCVVIKLVWENCETAKQKQKTS